MSLPLRFFVGHYRPYFVTRGLLVDPELSPGLIGCLGLQVCGATASIIVRVSVTVTAHHDQKQLGEARVLFSLQSVPHAEKAGQELKTGTGGRI